MFNETHSTGTMLATSDMIFVQIDSYLFVICTIYQIKLYI